MREQLAELPRLLTAHLELSLFAILVGICLSVPLGVLASRSRWLDHVVLSVAAGLQTMPSLALLALMVPLLGALGVSNIGYLPAFFALVLYSIFPILRNTVVGLASVDASLLEAAGAVGMSPRQQLFRVELPLALPVIVAGIRTATVWTVGAATLATPVGADSLGNYIFGGLQTRNVDAVLVGCVASAALALVLDGVGKFLLGGVERRDRKTVVLGLLLCAVLYLYAGASLAQKAVRSSRDAVTVGAKTFTEQYILSEILALHIQRTTGIHATVKQSLGSSMVFDALRSGSVDVYVDYSGTIWTTLMGRTDVSQSRESMLLDIERFLRADHGISLVADLGFENAYALAVRRSTSEKYGLRRITDLSRVANTLAIGGDYEFFRRPEWKTLSRHYRLGFKAQRPMDSSLMYQAIKSGAIDVVAAFSTDGRIAAYDLVVLDDDLGAIPPYDAIVLAGPRLVDTHPRVVAALRSLDGQIDVERMRAMNRAVAERRASPAEVARALVKEWSAGGS